MECDELEPSRRRDIEEKGHVQYREHDKHLYRLSTMNTNRCERQFLLRYTLIKSTQFYST
jgi:hypothetical protein